MELTYFFTRYVHAYQYNNNNSTIVACTLRYTKKNIVVYFKDYDQKELLKNFNPHSSYLHCITISSTTGEYKKYITDDDTEAGVRKIALKTIYSNRPDVIHKKLWEF